MEKRYMHTNPKKIIIASNNKHKIDEIKNILKDFPYEVLSMSEAGINLDVEENGKTFSENAYKKAAEIAGISGEITLADDSGLEVYALNGAPGVYSARFAGEHGNDKKNNIKLLELLKDVPNEKRGARFVCSMALITPSGENITAEGYVEGIIGYEEKGINGFGYDPLFYFPEYDKTFAQLTADEKNAISHRGRALLDLKEKLSQHLL
jgi:XTP/dITP diphosphohydrolase